MNNLKKKPAGKISQAIIAIESIVYSLCLFILCIPVYIGVYGWKFIKWFSIIAPNLFLVIVETILLPIFTLIWSILAFGIKYVVIGLSLLLKLIKYLYRNLLVYWSKINWCAVRSSIRIISIICIIGSIYTIIEGILQLPANTVVITGKFFDADGTIFRIHEAIALLLISITAFYNAWAYSKDEEVSFICTHTIGVSTLRKLINKIIK